MPGTPTTKYAIPTLAGSDLARDIDTLVTSSLNAIDAKMVGYSEGPIGSRPTSTPGSPGVAGREYRATDTGQLFKDTGTGWFELGTLPGDLKATARATAPDGWLLCDGAAVSRSTYAALFAALSTTYGSGDGSTTFNLPDMRGRVPVGVDGSAGRLDASDALGNAGGAQKHTMATSEMPAHGHRLRLHSGSGATGGSGLAELTGVGSGAVAFGTIGNVSGADIMENTGGGGAHNNMQPYQVVNYIIKT